MIPILGCERVSNAGSAAPVSDVKSDEVVVFFPTVAYPVEGGTRWDCRIHGWVYEPRSEREMAMESMRSTFGLGDGEDPDKDDDEKAIRSERARLFLVDNERGKHVVVQLDGRSYSLEPTAANGHCKGRLRLPAEEVARLRSAQGRPAPALRFRAALAAGDGRVFEGVIHLLEPNGLSVISDIDDTIKITDVHDRKATLRNTFLEPFHAVPGMADLYQKWAREPGTTFHYVSASPWQLFAPLEDFRRISGFPAGTYHLKPFRVKDESIRDFFDSPQTHKRAEIEDLLQSCPQRRFILVGDSGQEDPEIYGDIARRHPGRIERILIRDVTKQPRTDPRYDHAFRGLPESTWTIFREPSEVDR